MSGIEVFEIVSHASQSVQQQKLKLIKELRCKPTTPIGDLDSQAASWPHVHLPIHTLKQDLVGCMTPKRSLQRSILQQCLYTHLFSLCHWNLVQAQYMALVLLPHDQHSSIDLSLFARKQHYAWSIRIFSHLFQQKLNFLIHTPMIMWYIQLTVTVHSLISESTKGAGLWYTHTVSNDKWDDYPICSSGYLFKVAFFAYSFQKSIFKLEGFNITIS